MGLQYTHKGILIIDTSRGSVTGSGQGFGSLDPNKITAVLGHSPDFRSFQITIPSSSNTEGGDVSALAITQSNGIVSLGIGTSKPIGSLDIIGGGSTPPNILLRTNEDGVITPNEETGKIKFVIESGSFALSNDVQQLTQTVSGSTAEIFSRVTDVTSGGVRGSLVFGLSKNSVSSSIDALALGFNEGPPELASGDIHAVLSGSIAMNALTPRIILAKSDGTQPVAQIGSVNSSNLNEGSIILRDSSANDNGFFVIRKNQPSFLSGSGNFGIGTTTPSQKLDIVSGSARIKGGFSQLRLIEEATSAHMELGISNSDFFIKRGDNTHSIRFRKLSNADVMTIDMANERVGIGTNTPSAALEVNGDLIVTGSITAQQYIVSSSVTHMTTQFNSGSTIFGDTLEDTHEFTGSIDIDGNITSSGNITLADTITFNTSTTSSSAGTLTNPNIAGRPLVQLGGVNFAGEGITTIGAKARASTSHSIEEGTIVVSGSLGNIGSAASLKTKIPIAKISMLGSSCEWDLQVEIHSTSSAFNPTKIIYPRVGIHLPNSLDATGYFGDSNAGSRSFGPGIFQTATYSPSMANSIGNGEGTDGSILNPDSVGEYIGMLGVSIHNLCLHHQGIGSLFPPQGSFEAAPAFMKGNSFKSWIKWWIPTSAHTNPNTGAAGEGDFILGALSIDTSNVELFENVKTHDSSKVIITMKYKYIN